MEPARRISLTLDFCLRVGEVLLSSGAGAADVAATMRDLADAFGERGVDVDVTFTSLSMTHQQRPEDPPLTARRQIVRRTIDYRDLTRVDHLVRGVLKGDLDLLRGRAELRRIVSGGHDRPRWLVSVGWGAMSGGVAVMLGGGWFVIALAVVAALCIDRLQLRVARRALPPFYQQVTGAGVATLIAVMATFVPIEANVSLVITANIVMLLAGIGFMGALQDALTGFYITATARITEALLSTAGIIAGVSGGLSIAAAVGVELPTLALGDYDFQTLGLSALGAAVAAAGFAYASYAPVQVLAPIAVLSGAAVTLSRSIEAPGLARSWSVAVAALAVGLLGYAVAQRLKVPPLIVVVSAVVPMLPGVSIYRGLALMGEGTRRDTSEGLVALFTAASVALAIAGGVLLGEHLAQPLSREVQRLESQVEARLVSPGPQGFSRFATPHLVGPARGLSAKIRERQPHVRGSQGPGQALREASQRPAVPAAPRSKGAEPDRTVASTQEQLSSASDTTSGG